MVKHLTPIVFALTLAIGLPVNAQGETAKEKPPLNVLMIVVDTLRADHLGCYGYERETSPNIDKLAKQGVLFERCYSTSSWTLPAVASLLSSKPPARHGATGWTDKVAADVPWLPSVLQERGYHTMAVTSNPFLTKKHGFDRGFDQFDSESVIASAQWSFPRLKSKYKALVLASTSATATRRSMELLNKRPENEPFFMMLHYMDPHADYVPPEPFNTKFTGDYEGNLSGHVQSENIGPDIPGKAQKHIKALYDGEIAHVDRYIGQVLDHLEALDIRDQTAVIVTADHGEELLDHGQWGHGRTLYEEVIRVPLIIDWPGDEASGHRVSAPVSLLDLPPTVLNGLDKQVPKAMDGRDLSPALQGGEVSEEQTLTASTSLGAPLHAVIRGDKKIIAEITGGSSPTLRNSEFYDLSKDPEEQEPQASEATQQTLTQLLKGHLKQTSVADKQDQSQKLNSGHRKRLRSLGYGDD